MQTLVDAWLNLHIGVDRITVELYCDESRQVATVTGYVDRYNNWMHL